MTTTTFTPASRRPGAKGLVGLTVQLTAARFRARQGESLLWFAGVLAYTVAAALALTVASGTWAFWRRWQHPTGMHAELMAQDETFSSVLVFYFALALFACALLIPATINLASGAALLGARGRERRLSALRLIGLTSGDVVRMSMLDALVQLVIGSILGALIYVMTLPLWGNLQMQGVAFSFSEMLIPGWLMVAVLAGVGAVGLFATARGLKQVRISPLGVARRANKPALSWVRLLVFLVILAVATVVINGVQPGTQLVPLMTIAGVVILIAAGINILGPWLLQVEARTFAKLPWPSWKWAARRIAADPGATWRRVSGMALLAFIGGYTSLMPFAVDPAQGSREAVDFAHATQWDITKGVMITLAMGFVLTATSMLITQASATIERCEQSQALHKMGATTSFSLKTMWLETFGPLVVSVVTAATIGVVLALPMYQFAKTHGFSSNALPMIVAVLVVGLLLGAGSLLASHPLYFSLLRREERRND